MFTRKQYMAKECSHREFYGQFVTETIKDVVSRQIGLQAIKESKDFHLNDIPLAKWDAVFAFNDYGVNRKIRDCGDFPSLAGYVCIAKEAARQLMEYMEQQESFDDTFNKPT